MAYVHCMPALVLVLRHALDNIVEGTLRTSRGDLTFKTRSHIVKATNKIYKGCSWKPSAGSQVLVDGDLSGDTITVDHIELDHSTGLSSSAINPHLDALAAKLPGHPPATKELRVWREGTPKRLRFVEAASRKNRLGKVQDEIVHAQFDGDQWMLWTVKREGGEFSSIGIDEAILPILMRASGASLLTRKTQQEKVELEEALKDQSYQAATSIMQAEDCPF